MRRFLLILLIYGLVSSFSHNREAYYKFVVDSVMVDTIPVLNRENVEKELIRRNIPHYKIVLAQSILETGNYTSNHCKKRNNIFGMRNKKGYKYYNNWIECVDEYERRFSKRYKGGDYFVFLRKVKYAEDPAYEQKIKKLL